MSLTTVVSGKTIYATDINQIINVLQQPSGGQEKGKYYLESGVYATNAYFATYYRSTSQGSTPVSLNIDTADHAPNGCNSPATSWLTSYGFQVKDNATGAGTDAYVGGNTTLQF